MAIERFIDEIGTDLNKFQVTTSSGETYEITLLRKANISQTGTLLNATKLNELVDEINSNTISISQLSTVARTGSYNDLTNKPTLFDGNYNSLTNKPTSLPASDVYAWAKASTKPTYTASEVGTYTTNEIDAKLNAKQNVINSNNKIDYLFIKNTPTIPTVPTKLSQLTNDNNNVYINKTSWTIASALPETGLYLIQVYNTSVSPSFINLGVCYFMKSGTMRVASFYAFVGSSLNHYYVTVDANGKLTLYLQTGNSVAIISNTNFYYIKLS